MATPPTFTTGSVLTAAQMNAVGLWKIATTTFSASTLVEVNNCFSSDYDNYLVMTSFYGNGTGAVWLRVKTATAETGAVYDRNAVYWYANAWNAFDAANQTYLFLQNHVSTSTNKSAGSLTFYNPNKAEQTAVLSQFSDYTGQFMLANHRIETTTQYTGIQMFSGGYTITGSVSVYGYRL